ncbi:hypothetical protein [Clavibacter nebraskensis]|uniref:hypothetical protein n=1 Tax=Clavibacter nebraskensis TaxID=31963 RepID=UPI003F858AA8
MSAVPAPGALPVVAPLLAMRGSADAAACEGDACLVPGSASAVGDAEGSASADLARLRDAIDSGRAI